MYTVKQLSDLAGVSVRTLHYYDEIGLLNPSEVGTNGYRYYDEASVMRLQQILFYREIGLELVQIKTILDSPDFDLLAALHSHRQVLQNKMNRLQNLIGTVDETMMHLSGETPMSRKRMFEAFSDEKQKEYEREARLQYGAENVNDSIRRWNRYSKAQQEAIMAEAGQIYNEITDALEADKSPQDEEVQAILERWHQNLHHFYEPTLEILRGLGELYNTEPEFIKNFQQMHPDLPQYLQDGIRQYVDDLEHREIERMLAEDEHSRRLQG